MVIPIKNLVASQNMNKADMASRNIILKIHSRCYQYCSSLCTSCFFFQASCWDRIKKRAILPIRTLLGKSLSANWKRPCHQALTSSLRFSMGFWTRSRRVSRMSFEWDTFEQYFSILVAWTCNIFAVQGFFFRAYLGSMRCHIINSKGRHVSVCGLI